MNKKKLCRDLEYGFKCEDRLFSKFKKIWGDDIKKTNQYDTFDYMNDDIQIELKNRRCYSYTYPSMMIGLNKLIDAELNKRRSVFVWNLKDGLFYWNYNKDEYTTAFGGRKDRGIDERKITAFIDMKHLKRL